MQENTETIQNNHPQGLIYGLEDRPPLRDAFTVVI